MARRKSPTPGQIGRGGELFVAAELNRRGAIASLYLTNMPRVDVVASSPEQTRIANIQVKAKGPGSRGWQGDIREIRSDAEKASEDELIVLVDLSNENGAPDYYVCPLKAFERAHWDSHSGFHPDGRRSWHTSIDVKDIKHGKDDWGILEILPASPAE